MRAGRSCSPGCTSSSSSSSRRLRLRPERFKRRSSLSRVSACQESPPSLPDARCASSRGLKRPRGLTFVACVRVFASPSARVRGAWRCRVCVWIVIARQKVSETAAFRDDHVKLPPLV